MDFETTDFGIVGTEDNINVDSFGESILFSDPKEVKPVEVKPIKEEKPKEEDDFNTEPLGSILLEEEDKTTEVDSVEETPIEDEPKEEVEQVNLFKNFSKDLFNLGLFQEEDEESEIDSPEAFVEKWKKDAKKAGLQEAYNIISQHGQRHIDFFQAVYMNGVDPETFWKSQSRFESIESLDISDSENQKLAVRQYYTNLGWNPEKINNKLTKLEEYGDLEDEAQVAKEKLTEQEKNFQQQEVLKKQQELESKKQQEDFYKNKIYTILQNKLKARDFDGITVSDKVAAQTFDYMSNKKWRTQNGEELSDFDRFLLDLKRPENYEIATKIALLAQNNMDLTKIKAKAISNETNELFKNVQGKTKTTADKRMTPAVDNFKF